MPGKNGGICSKHFEEKFLKTGKRTTLQWDLNPVPSIYLDSSNFPPSLLPSVLPKRKSPTRTEFSDQISEFKQKDEIKYFSQINERVCAPSYQLTLQKNKAIFYETENCPFSDIPLVTETIVVTDSLNVKLFWKAIPVPLPEWFRKGSNCRLKSQSMLDNFLLIYEVLLNKNQTNCRMSFIILNTKSQKMDQNTLSNFCNIRCC